MPPDIVILGVFVADAAFRCDRLPKLGETLIGTGFTLGPGGKGSNQAVAAAKSGGDVGFLTRIGDDTFGAMGRAVWAEAGVRSMAITDAARATGAAGIFIEETQGRNAIVISPGAAAALSVSDVEAEAVAIATAKVAMTQLEQPMAAALRFLQIAAAGGAVTILNPAPATALPDGMLALCDYLTPNETEAEALTSITVTDMPSATRAAKALLAQGVRRAVIVTLGGAGAVVVDADGARGVAPMQAGPAVDTTGAGDAFNGGFATALAEGQPLDDALRFATAVAALSVTKPGTAASMPARAEVGALLGR
ncbi:ribokinase [Roseicyclus mahoneyensis]|uniref:Ribokinase n=1 Tax=Roseicyclus mahoneyensis TaxID=164332 RepID=A0A316GFZ5_9RHOB|nr:ribokinase [Roseicyclus mahoneyensis]PWK59907.1 6-phosphofructokinase [Roseicyclus mahoneyensis]